MTKKRGPHGLFLLAKRSLAPTVWMPLLSIATLGVVLALTNHSVSADHPQPQPAAQPVAAIPQPAPTAPPQPATAPKPQPKAQAPARPAAPVPTPAPKAQPAAAPLQPYCKVAAYSTPGAIAPESAAPGVTETTNSPVYYRFRGSSTFADTIAQATQCARRQAALGGIYHGLTSRTISYTYDIASSDGVACRIVDVKVTLHQSILLPQADMSGMPAAAAAQWNAAAKRLQAHEYEHVAINRQHARTLHSQLASLTGPCINLSTQASTTIKRIIAAMHTANNALDVHTNHGRL